MRSDQAGYLLSVGVSAILIKNISNLLQTQQKYCCGLWRYQFRGCYTVVTLKLFYC